MAGILAGIMGLFGFGCNREPHILDVPDMVHDFCTDFQGSWVSARNAGKSAPYREENM